MRSPGWGWCRIIISLLGVVLLVAAVARLLLRLVVLQVLLVILVVKLIVLVLLVVELIVLVVLVLLGHSVHLPSWTTGRLAIAAYAPIDVHS